MVTFQKHFLHGVYETRIQHYKAEILLAMGAHRVNFWGGGRYKLK